ncbi:MAG: hypothetical protein KAX88_06310 [Rhodoferax sp.]|nr:hypothetical protein [Rhodoferax sp.]
MNISPYFRHLRSAYAAELDDLTFDSEGQHILDKRLTQRRKEMEFLVSMMEISPEMVAAVFHKGFRFTSHSAMDHLLTLESDEFPDWDHLTHAFEMAPWTQPLVETVQKQPMGDWFLTVAAALEYMFNKAEHVHASAPTEEEDTDGEPLDEEEREARASEEAGADWMVEQGFDRKDAA